jgi:hypothetical protein
MCNKVLYPVSFATRNAAGEGDYFGGIPPTCPAGDDVEHLLGDAQEGSLREALTFIRTGACSSAARSASMAVRPRAVATPADGWAELVGAH